ncbi:MAG: enoyl-CoA hydratase/isomerase family protein [Marinovum sp.]|jgi:enoyl-CoA hydratase/carnithine racemase|nr:enoyl-CoA hydratase/isomerase family protein [Marinovum sp.]MBT6927265.1 enoyl-CoA hydratase/isomerase family protein [Marinovum sp.]HAM89170.1 enoyl-CoA hydratase [Paracoccaceae bacterium]
MITLDRQEGLWKITLNRPEKANALTAAMLQELAEIAEAAQQARGLIITGAGGVFSAGGDLDEMTDGLATSALWERLSTAIAAVPGLSIAALNGTLAGGAMGMALACDIRLAVPQAKFFYPVMKRGFLPQPSDPLRMSALIGPARTKLILMGGQKLTAQEALQFGLIERVLEPEDLLPTAENIAADTMAASPEIARGIRMLCG